MPAIRRVQGIPAPVGVKDPQLQQILWALKHGVENAASSGDVTALNDRIGLLPAPEGTVGARPPPITGLAAAGAFSSIIVQWDDPSADSSYVEVYAADSDSLSLAVVVGTGAGRFFTHYVGPGETRYYWVKAVGFSSGTIAPLKSDFNATAGTVASTGEIDGQFIEDFTIDTSQIKDAAIVTEKLAAASVDSSVLANLAVTAAKLASNSVTNTKLVSNAVRNQHIFPDAITSSKIQNAAVGNAAIANLAVGTSKIANAAIVEAKIGNLAVSTAKLQNAAISTAKIANAAITSALILDGAIVNAKIGNAAVDSAQIANLAVVTATIGNLQVDTIKIADNAVTDGKYAFVGSEQGSVTIGSPVTLVSTTYQPDGNPIIIQFFVDCHQAFADVSGLDHEVKVKFELFYNGGSVALFNSPFFEKRYISGAPTLNFWEVSATVSGVHQVFAPGTNVDGFSLTATLLAGTSFEASSAALIIHEFKK
ncbi:MAG: hypothetical protein L0H83_07750 [Salinisphaera sp.]|nr:hypothetical protein [Salinisphaera sp.]